MQDDIRAIVRETFASELSGLEIGDDVNLFSNGIIDSFALVNLVSALEDRYGIRIPDSDATPANLGSVELATRYIAGRTGA